MTFVKYNLLQGYDVDNNPILLKTTIEYNDLNMKNVKRDAYNGEYEFVEIEMDEDFEKIALIKNNEELTEENVMLKAQVAALSEQMTFYEDCIAEMAMIVYS